MTVKTHLTRKPYARGKTIAWLALRDEITAKLASETKAAKAENARKLDVWVSPQRLRAVASALRCESFDLLDRV